MKKKSSISTFCSIKTDKKNEYIGNRINTQHDKQTSQILHTTNIRSHKITGNSSESEKLVKYSHPSPIKNKMHPLQNSKDNYLNDKCRALAWNPTTNIEDLPATKLKQSHDQDMLDSR